MYGMRAALMASLLFWTSSVFAGGLGVQWHRQVFKNTTCVTTAQCLPLLDLPHIASVACVTSGVDKGHCRVLWGECYTTENYVGTWNAATTSCNYHAVIPDESVCWSDADCVTDVTISQYGSALVNESMACLPIAGVDFGVCGSEVQSVECCAFGVSVQGACLPPVMGCLTDWECGQDMACVSGSCVYVPLAKPVVSHIDLTNSQLVNGQSRDLYKFTVSVVENHEIAIKQFKIHLFWQDNGNNDSLQISHVRLYRNGTDVSDQVTLNDQNGNPVSGGFGLTEADTTLIVTWLSENIVPGGSTTTFTLRGIPEGFHLNASDPTMDMVVLRLNGDSAPVGASRFLNSEADQSALQAAILELAMDALSGAADGVAANFIWSDMQMGHMDAIDTQSSGDWFNGFAIANLPLLEETWFK